MGKEDKKKENAVTKELKATKMTAHDFAGLTGFNEVDRQAVKILYKEQIKPYISWVKLFKDDFVFNQ